MSVLEELIRGAAEDGVNKDRTPPDLDAPHVQQRIEALRKLAASFSIEDEFHKGDIDRWKAGLKNRNGTYGDVMIVLEALDTPVIDEEEPTGSAYFLEPLDIICAALVQGCFVPYYYDSRRL